MYLRMISKKAKWEQYKQENPNDLSSDVITNCLKTKDETLSLWYLDDVNKVDDAIIALAANRQLLNPLDYLLIPDEYIEKYSLELDDKEGTSPYSEFNNNHRNIINLSYSLLGAVSMMILDIINSNQGEIKRVSARDILNKLQQAIKEGILSLESMDQDLLSKIKEMSNER